jgi:ADP-ribose pyrophosphatase YjhB (NUDIX family)
MGYPNHTIELPRRDMALAQELSGLVIDPDDDRFRLMSLVTGDGVAPEGSHGHLCSTAWVIDDSAQWTLLVLHRRLGWVVPGGHAELGETLRDAAMRELREETGLAMEPFVDSPVLLHRADFPAGAHRAHTHWNVGFVFIASRDAVTHAEADDTPVAWWPINALPTPRVPDLAPNLTRILAWMSRHVDA